MPDDVDLSAFIDHTGGGPDNTGDSFEPANPAWKEFVGDAPKDVYEKHLEPAFKKWDHTVNERFNKYNQQYEPWKDFVKATDPETAGFAVNLLNAINNNPQEVISKLTEYYKLGNATGANAGQGQSEPNVVEEDPYAKRFAELEERSALLAQALIAQRKEEENKQAESWLDSELSRLQQANQQRGPFDENYVCAIAANNGNNLEAAVEQYYEMANKIASQSRPKPLIAGNGGGAPGGQRINPRQLSTKDANSLVVDILNANLAQNQQ